MAYQKKVWRERQSEFPNRRVFSPTGKENEYDVTRAEGNILEDGDALTAANINDMEGRIGAGFESTCTYVYTGTVLLDGWVAGTDEDGTAYWTQTVAVASIDGGPPLTAASQLMGPMDKPTGVRATDEALAEVLRVVNDGVTTPGAGALTCRVWELPEADAQIYWPAKEGAQ